jgi:DNA-binding transcriptional MerR regulator
MFSRIMLTGDMTIGQIGRQVGLSVETIRFYERRGLIPEPGRTASGYRKYSQEAVGRLRFIKRARQMEFSLDEIAELLALRESSDSACVRVHKMAHDRMRHLREQLQRMQEAVETLRRMVDGCNGSGGQGCRFLTALDSAG